MALCLLSRVQSNTLTRFEAEHWRRPFMFDWNKLRHQLCYEVKGPKAKWSRLHSQPRLFVSYLGFFFF